MHNARHLSASCASCPDRPPGDPSSTHEPFEELSQDTPALAWILPSLMGKLAARVTVCERLFLTLGPSLPLSGRPRFSLAPGVGNVDTHWDRCVRRAVRGR